MTPANLRAIRLRIGLSFEETASLLGLDAKSYGPKERAKTINVYEHDLKALRALEGEFNDFLNVLTNHSSSVLLGFMNDQDFHTFEPDLASRLRFNSVHRMAIAIAQSDYAADGAEIPIVEMVPDFYSGWLLLHGKQDDRSSREEWAIDRLKAFRIVAEFK
jgi:transcriptional regulator with XRE-family HTH domain